MSPPLPTTAQAKDQAKRLRAKMAEDATEVSHAKSLELIAHEHGFRDWNTMGAAIGRGPDVAWSIGDRVTGHYLAQPFTAHVASVRLVSPGWVQLSLHLVEAIDVVTSEHFTNYRSRIRGIVGPKGNSAERTSDGRPHLEIDL